MNLHCLSRTTYHPYAVMVTDIYALLANALSNKSKYSYAYIKFHVEVTFCTLQVNVIKSNNSYESGKFLELYMQNHK